MISTLHVTALRGQGCTELQPGARVGPRILDDWQLLLVTAGTADWERGGERITLESGDLLLAPPGERERCVVPGPEAFRFLFVHVHLAGPVARLPRHVQRAGSGLADPLLRHAIHLAVARPAGWQAQALDVLGVLLRAVANRSLALPEEPLRPLSQPVARALAHLRERWRGGLVAVGAAEMARAAKVSREHLTRCFQAEFSLGPGRAERLLRLDRAVDWLIGSELPVPEVARRAGWRDPDRFAAALRSAFGRSPQALRRAWRGGHGVRQSTLVRLGTLRAATR